MTTPPRTKAPAVRKLGMSDLPEAVRLCEREPLTSILLAEYLGDVIAGIRSLVPGTLLAWPMVGPMRALAWVAPAAVVIAPDAEPEAIAALSAALAPHRRWCASIVGKARVVMPVWEQVEPVWGRAREIRPDQPVMVAQSPSAVAADPHMRRAVAADLPVLVPACARMFTEEVGYPPVSGPLEGSSYEARVAYLVRAGRSYIHTADGPDGLPRVVAKMEVGAQADGLAQLQGVWVDPAERGRGLAAPAVTAVVAALTRQAMVTSLYVNSFNERALRTYRTAGFVQRDTCATVLL